MSSPEAPEEMLLRSRATGAATSVLIAVANRWIEKWSELAARVDAGELLDGRASIYTGETYAEARDRWTAYRELLLQSLPARAWDVCPSRGVGSPPEHVIDSEDCRTMRIERDRSRGGDR